MSPAPHITRHAKRRIKERCGIPPRRQAKEARRALEEGLSHEDASGALSRYLDGRAVRGGPVLFRIWRGRLWVFKGSPPCVVTVIVPVHRLRRRIARLEAAAKARAEPGAGGKP